MAVVSASAPPPAWMVRARRSRSRLEDRAERLREEVGGKDQTGRNPIERFLLHREYPGRVIERRADGDAFRRIVAKGDVPRDLNANWTRRRHPRRAEEIVTH